MEGIDLGAEIRRIVSKIETSNPDMAATARYRQAWRAVADPSALSHTDALYVIPGTQEQDLIIYVDSQIWATELNLQSEVIRLRLNMKLNEGRQVHSEYDDLALFEYGMHEKIKHIQFVPSKEKYAHRNRGLDEDIESDENEAAVEPVALDEQELAALNEEVSKIEDEKLRKVAFEAAKSNLELIKAKENQQ